MLPCGCARGHCEAADAADCRRIQASAESFKAVCALVAAAAREDAVNSGREKLAC